MNSSCVRLVRFGIGAAAVMVLAACHFPDERPTTTTAAAPKAIFAVLELQVADFSTPAQPGAAAPDADNKVKDAGITAAVSGELARDPDLADLLIDVDTVNGYVALRGMAPDVRSRKRAGTVAARVDGVVAVDNQLNIVVRPMAMAARALVNS